MAHCLSLAVGLGVLLWLNRQSWFYGDEWDFLADRSVLVAPLDLLRPHNEHWSTLPILVYRLLYAVFGLHSYVPYILLAIVIHLGVVHLLWRLLRRGAADPWIATAAAGVFVLFGAGWENLLWAFQITFNGSLLFGLGHVLLVDHPGRFDRRDRLGYPLAVAGLATSGISVTMVAVAGLTVLLRRGWRQALLTVVPPAAVFLAWLVTVGREGLGTHDGPIALARVPPFVWHGLSTTVDVAVGVMGASLVTFAGLVLWAFRHGSELRGRRAASVACAAGAVGVFTIAALGRAGLSTDLSRSSRYLYLAGALLLPAVGLALSDATRRHALARAVAVMLLAVVAAHSASVLRGQVPAEAARDQEVRRVILAASQLDLRLDQVLAPLPEPRFTPNLGLNELQVMRAAGKLPDPGEVNPADRLSALSALQVTATSQPALPAYPAGSAKPMVVGLAGATPTPAAGGCLRLDARPFAQVVLAFPAPATMRLGVLGPELHVALAEPNGAVAGWPRILSATPGQPQYVNVNAVGATAVVTLPAGPATLCSADFALP